MTAPAALLPALRAALDIEPPPGDPLDGIEHVVILMQENRGFDHYFGTMPGVRGFDDQSVVLQEGTLRTVFEQPDGHGAHVRPHAVDEEAIKGQPHDWISGHVAWNGGRMDRWIPAKGAQTMSHCRREDIPFYFALAEAFTVCDAYHCSVLGPTIPNRNHLFSGMTGFEAWGDRAIENDAWDRPEHSGYAWTTYAERLEAAGITWQVFQEWDNYGCNNLEFHAEFQEIGRRALAATGYAETRYFYDAIIQADERRRAELLQLLATGVDALSPSERSLYDRALTRVPTGSLADAFRTAIGNGSLPKVTYLIPSQAESEHPDSGTDAATGAALTERLVEALASFPEVYAKTVLFITYDENDGFFDHVPPPVPPPGTPDEEYVDGLPIGLGARVPMTIVSPWSRGGYVCSETYDHTSIVRFLERWTGVAEPNISAWRRAMCGDLTATLGAGVADRIAAGPPDDVGHRRARALPYQPDVFMDSIGGLVMVNSGSAACQIGIYANRFRTDGPWRFDVGPGATVTGSLGVEGAYDLSCFGPNRFLRRFTGDLATHLSVTSSVDAESVRLTIRNDGAAAVVFTVNDEKHQAAPGTAVGTTWLASAEGGGWYDLTVACDVDPTWSRRLIGRVEP